MGRRKDLDDRLGLALGTSGPARPFDNTITRAMRERRRQFLDRDDEAVASDTAVIQARLAAARRKADEALFAPGEDGGPDTIDLSRRSPDDAA